MNSLLMRGFWVAQRQKPTLSMSLLKTQLFEKAKQTSPLGHTPPLTLTRGAGLDWKCHEKQTKWAKSGLPREKIKPFALSHHSSPQKHIAMRPRGQSPYQTLNLVVPSYWTSHLQTLSNHFCSLVVLVQVLY